MWPESYVAWIVCDLNHMWPESYVTWIVCDLNHMWPDHTWPKSYVAWMICGLNRMWPESYVTWIISRPQEIDEAARRRFVKRLYIPLPESPARQQIVVNLLSQQTNSLTEQEMDSISAKTDGRERTPGPGAESDKKKIKVQTPKLHDYLHWRKIRPSSDHMPDWTKCQFVYAKFINHSFFIHC